MMSKLEQWKKWKLIKKDCCTVLSAFLFLTAKAKSCCSSVLLGKYHNGGLWTNTCCSHPLPGEDVLAAANRRLLEEMGFTTTLSQLLILLIMRLLITV